MRSRGRCPVSATERDVRAVVGRSALHDALQRVALVAGRARPSLPVVGCLLAEGVPGGVRFTGTDFDQYLSTSVPAVVDDRLRFCVNAKALLGIVALLPAADVTLVTDAKSARALKITCGRASFEVPCLDPAEFPTRTERPNAGAFDVPSHRLIPALARTVPHVHDSEGRPTLMGVCLTASAAGLDVAASDGHAAYRERISTEAAAGNALGEWIIPTSTVVSISRLFAKSDAVAVTVGENCVAFGDGVTSLVSRVIAGPFPQLDPIFRRAYNESRSIVPLVPRTTVQRHPVAADA